MTTLLERERCERCGAELEFNAESWLEFDSVDGRYRLPGEVDENRSQGLFPFGADCWKRVILDGGLIKQESNK